MQINTVNILTKLSPKYYSVKEKQGITMNISSSNMQYRTQTDFKETGCGIHVCHVCHTKDRCTTMNAYTKTKTCALISHVHWKIGMKPDDVQVQ